MCAFHLLLCGVERSGPGWGRSGGAVREWRAAVNNGRSHQPLPANDSANCTSFSSCNFKSNLKSTLTSPISPEGQAHKVANKCNSGRRWQTATHNPTCRKSNAARWNVLKTHFLLMRLHWEPLNFFWLFENSYHFVSFVPMMHLNPAPFTGIKYALLRDNKRTLKSKYTTLLCMCVWMRIYVCACVRFK